jgi:ubiquinone biosynthesis protein COQ9
MNDPLESEKQAILAAVLRHVPFDGWSQATLDAAVRDAGYDATMAERAFPNGVRDVIAFFVADADRRLAWELTKQDISKLPIRERIKTAVKLRIEQNAPHREAIRKAVALQLMPGFGVDGLRGLYHTVDLIWRAAGDTSTDFSFYTKRMLLAGVYSSTLAYWLDDGSEDYADTWAFLDRRIADVMRITKLRGTVEKTLGRLPNPATFLGKSPLARAAARRRRAV